MFCTFCTKTAIIIFNDIYFSFNRIIRTFDNFASSLPLQVMGPTVMDTTYFLIWSSLYLCLFFSPLLCIPCLIANSQTSSCISQHCSLACVSEECSIFKYLSPIQKSPESISGWMWTLGRQSIKMTGIIYLAGATHLLPYHSNIHEVSSGSGFQHPVGIKMAGGNCPFP